MACRPASGRRASSAWCCAGRRGACGRGPTASLISCASHASYITSRSSGGARSLSSTSARKVSRRKASLRWTDDCSLNGASDSLTAASHNSLGDIREYRRGVGRRCRTGGGVCKSCSDAGGTRSLLEFQEEPQARKWFQQGSENRIKTGPDTTAQPGGSFVCFFDTHTHHTRRDLHSASGVQATRRRGRVVVSPRTVTL